MSFAKLIPRSTGSLSLVRTVTFFVFFVVASLLQALVLRLHAFVSFSLYSTSTLFFPSSFRVVDNKESGWPSKDFSRRSKTSEAKE